MSDVESIEQAAQFLEVGQHVRIACPFCSPPKEDAECMRVTRWDTNKVSAKCFRATCGRSVRMTIGGGYVVHNGDAEAVRPGFVSRQLDKPLRFADLRFADGQDWRTIEGLSSPDLAEWFHHQWAAGHGHTGLRVTDDDNHELVFAVANPWSGRVGYQVRVNRDRKPNGPKYDTFREIDAPFVHFAGPQRCTTVVVVEDWLSAEAITAATHHRVAALAAMGGHISDEVLVTLAKRHPNVVFFLDPGAEQAAHRLAKRSSLMFKNVGVVRAPADPKRLLFGELQNILAPFLAQAVAGPSVED